jgi:hypothetical protein
MKLFLEIFPVPKYFVLPKRMTKPVELEGILQKTDEGIIVKNVLGEIIADFEPGSQWWNLDAPEPVAKLSRLSPAALVTYEALLKALKSGTITEDIWEHISETLKSSISPKAQ